MFIVITFLLSIFMPLLKARKHYYRWVIRYHI